MDINDDAGLLNAHGALWFFASMLAPTGDHLCQKRIKTTFTRGNTSISRVSIIEHLTYSIQWYNVYISGMYHSIKS